MWYPQTTNHCPISLFGIGLSTPEGLGHRAIGNAYALTYCAVITVVELIRGPDLSIGRLRAAISEGAENL